MIETNKENVVLEKILYIHYPIWFRKNEVCALIDFKSKVNIITLAYASKLGFKTHFTNFKAQKIDDSIFKTFKMVWIYFQIEDKFSRAHFF